MLNVASMIAPFIAGVASIAGATKLAYGTNCPPMSKPPMRAPTPTPMENR